MDITPQIFTANVMHKRLFPAENQFSYRIFYLSLPLSEMKNAEKRGLAINRRAPISFHNCDHGHRDKNENLQQWVVSVLKESPALEHIENIVLVTMPRILGYVFNPVSFWLCLDNAGNIRAVVNEVNNTFGETHTYLCSEENGEPLTEHTWLSAQKVFHVSPFLAREGHYKFKYALKNNRLSIHIDYYDETNNKQLITALSGKLIPLNKKNLRKVFWRYPLVTLKSISLIHWQAVKLVYKRVRYYRKPDQIEERVTHGSNITRM